MPRDSRPDAREAAVGPADERAAHTAWTARVPAGRSVRAETPSRYSIYNGELFIPGIFHRIFLDRSWALVTEQVRRATLCR